MKMQIWISAAGLALAAPLLAQTPVEVSGVAGAPGTAWQLIATGGIPMNWEAPLVSGHPYSATARTMDYSPDGLHVDSSHSEMIYRDDQGRTRREVNGGRDVAILDPAAGVAYNLDADRMVAMKRTLGSAAIANQTRVPSQTLLELAAAEAKNRQNMNVEDLGTQVVNGVEAQGVRVITVIPTGQIGNDRDLKTVVDRWVSSDLHVLVKSVTTSSRSGPVHYDLTNLVLGPPDPALFQVPPGYKIQEVAQGIKAGSFRVGGK
jgi:hypothetical protein